MTDYSLALFSHLLVVVFLLGGDFGRLYLARAGASPATAPAARALAARGVLWTSRITNMMLILVIPVGYWLGSILNAYRIDSPPWRLVPWLLPGLLLVLMIAADNAADKPGGGRIFAGAETALRVVFGAGQVWDGVSVIFLNMTHMVEAHWLASKLSIYGFVLLLSIPVRHAELKLRREIAQADFTNTPQYGAEALAKPLHRISLPIATSGLLVLLAIWLGAAKPV